MEVVDNILKLEAFGDPDKDIVSEAVFDFHNRNILDLRFPLVKNIQKIIPEAIFSLSLLKNILLETKNGKC